MKSTKELELELEMALQIHSSSPLKLLNSNLFISQSKPQFIIRSQKPTIDPETTNEPVEPQNPTSPGLGFGSKKQSISKGKGRASVIRRSPIEKPVFVSKENEEKMREESKTENAFLLTWLGLGIVIFVQGILLAASGFLPEEWDSFFVKFLYPSFTPTVGLFVAGSVAYGGLKYLQNEQLKK